ncbi:probable E3 ubiquitin-protein ligase RHC2A [Andrographis paniculata]|uniref:probable E3 ubiquitin-protein ligase RHC2A n=1 Tax=Andrographis paniculata TaxID=175694 RepID=UPI0021E93C9E|nr:probable E3 ubiquitin-protein ligase RHC2A [Andrographis paniculata]
MNLDDITAQWAYSIHELCLVFDEPTDDDTIYGFCEVPVPSSQLTINFELVCKYSYTMWRFLPTGESVSRRTYAGHINHPTTTIQISITKDHMHSHPREMAQIFKDKLQHLPISNEDRYKVLAAASNRYVSAMLSKNPDNYVYDSIWIRCSFKVLFDVLVGERRDTNIEPALDLQSAEEVGAQMVPTAEVSIESSLKKVVVADDSKETCSICLEVMHGSEFEVMRMPCSHVFHGDCIRKWLRTSHYCPVCRFELPKEI